MSDLGQRSKNDHEIWNMYIVMYSTFILLYIPTFTSQTSIVSEYSITQVFSHTNASGTKVDFCVKKSKVNLVSSFEQI